MRRGPTLCLLLLLAAPALAAPPAPGWPQSMPLLAALAKGLVRAEDVSGREVYAYDETRIGVLLRAGRAGLIRLDPAFGSGLRCVAVGLGRLRLAPENRLLLDMNDHEFRAALAERGRCGL